MFRFFLYHHWHGKKTNTVDISLLFNIRIQFQTLGTNKKYKLFFTFIKICVCSAWWICEGWDLLSYATKKKHKKEYRTVLAQLGRKLNERERKSEYTWYIWRLPAWKLWQILRSPKSLLYTCFHLLESRVSVTACLQSNTENGTSKEREKKLILFLER